MEWATSLAWEKFESVDDKRPVCNVEDVLDIEYDEEILFHELD